MLLRVPWTVPSSSTSLEMDRDPDVLESVAQDAAAMRGAGALGVVEPRSEAQLAQWLRDHPSLPILVQGGLTSLTGGATPDGDVVISLRRLTSLQVDRTAHRARVGPGVVLAQLQAALLEDGLYYPPAPTHDGATLGGMASTNAAGAATFKYGVTRDWITRMRVVLRTGQVLDLRRGQYVAGPGDRFMLGDAPGIELRVPTYRTPSIKKISAGYFVREPFDLIDLFIGAEGTLGMITELEVAVIERPAVLTGLLFLPSVDAACSLADELRQRSLETRAAPATGGLDVRSIEFFDDRCLGLLRAESKLASLNVTVPDHARACLLFEQEMSASLSYDEIVSGLSLAAEGGDAPPAFQQLMEALARYDAVDSCELALPTDARRQHQLASVREAIPLAVSDWLRRTKVQQPAVHKVAGDMMVPFERFQEMLTLYYEVFERCSVPVLVFGHISDGNVHPNALPRDAVQMAMAKRALMELAEHAQRLGGCPLSEHGVGKHPTKKAMLARFWGPEVMSQMRALKHCLDPQWTLGRGVLFDP